MMEGGCLCGATRYRVGVESVDCGYCHCRMCQRSAGAPVLAWATIPTASLTWTKGRPRAYRSSEQAERLFCPDCGCQLVFRGLDEPDRIDLNVTTLDDPGVFRPEYHIWVSSRLPWFDTADTLPRYAEARPRE